MDETKDTEAVDEYIEEDYEDSVTFGEEETDFVEEDDSEGDIEDETEDETDEDDSEDEADDAPDPEEDERDATIAELKKKLGSTESLVRDYLKKIGVEDENIEDALMKLAAEADDVTLEEYKGRKAKADRAAEAEALLAKMQFERLMAEDLAAIQKYYPQTTEYKSVTQIPNFKEFARLRDLGLSPKQAFAAANPEYIAASSAQEAKGLGGTKSHIRSAVPQKRSGKSDIRISRSEMEQYREMFPGKTDKEILALYRATE